jgi:hypothetical protein
MSQITLVRIVFCNFLLKLRNAANQLKNRVSVTIVSSVMEAFCLE